MAFVFGSAKGGIHSPGGSLGEIEHKEAGEDFLENEFGLFCVEMDQTYGVFQASERGFDAPAHGVELSQHGYRELPGIQVGDEGLHVAGIRQQTDNAKRYLIKIRAVRL